MSKPYQKPTFAEQMGLKPNPNQLEHEFVGGVRLTKIHTTGGHSVDKDQPGFPIYHRRIANPFPLMALSIGATLMMLGLLSVGVRDIKNITIVYNIGLPYGAIGTVTAGMWAFAEGNTFLATLGMTFGGLIGGVSLVYLPWTGIQNAYILPAIEAANGNKEVGLAMGALALYKAVGILFLAAMIPVFLVFVASLRTAVPVASGAFIIVIGLILQGVGYLHYPMENLTKAGGALFIVVGVILWYAAVAVLMQEEGVNLPVFALPRNDD